MLLSLSSLIHANDADDHGHDRDDASSDRGVIAVFRDNGFKLIAGKDREGF